MSLYSAATYAHNERPQKCKRKPTSYPTDCGAVCCVVLFWQLWSQPFVECWLAPSVQDRKIG